MTSQEDVMTSQEDVMTGQQEDVMTSQQARGPKASVKDQTGDFRQRWLGEPCASKAGHHNINLMIRLMFN